MRPRRKKHIFNAVVIGTSLVIGVFVNFVVLPFVERLLIFNTAILGTSTAPPFGFGYMYSIPKWFTYLKYVVTAIFIILTILVGRWRIKKRFTEDNDDT